MMVRNVGKLEVSTPSDREVALTRGFDAPARLVWAAYTKPELVRRWQGGPPGWSLTTCEMDVRVGGKWRWVMTGPNGEVMGLGGQYLEVTPTTRLVSTEKFDQAWYEGEAVSSIDFVERDGRTTLTMRVKYASKDVRDAVLQTPMAEGVGAGFDQMETLLASMADGEVRS